VFVFLDLFNERKRRRRRTTRRRRRSPNYKLR